MPRDTGDRLCANADGVPTKVVLMPGEALALTARDDLVVERDSDPSVLLGDPGYKNGRPCQDARHLGPRSAKI